MDIGKSISFVFQDKDWLVKVAIGAAILLVSIPLTTILVGFLGVALVLGYGLEVVRNVRQGVAQPLPEWKDRWGEWMASGLKYGLVLLIWSLPAILLNTFNGLGNQLTWHNDGIVGFMGSMILITTACLGFFWWVFVALITPAITVRMAETDDVRSGLRFSDLYFLTRYSMGEVIVVVVASLVLLAVALVAGSVLGLLMCIIGLAVTLPAALFLTELITAHMIGQIGFRDAPARPKTADTQPEPAAKPAGKTGQSDTMVVMPDGTVITTDDPAA